MKKKKLKQELLKVYQIPPSCQKQNFFQGRRWQDAWERASFSSEILHGISFPEFLRIQAGYIRVRNWIFSFVLFFSALFFSTEAVREAGISGHQFVGSSQRVSPTWHSPQWQKGTVLCALAWKSWKCILCFLSIPSSAPDCSLQGPATCS